ncbi:MAG: hypothetical protein ACJAXH_003210 [Colwellia sp.]
MIEVEYAIPFLTLFIGVFIGNRFALGRDKHKESNNAIHHLREQLIHQIDSLSDQSYDDGINEKEIVKLVSLLGDKESSKIISAYKKYSDARMEAVTKKDEYGQFTINQIGFNLFLEQSKILLKAMSLK